MRLIDDPPPRINPDLPEWQQALARIKLEVLQVEHENPGWTPQQILREARARCSQAMVAAAEAQEQLAYRRS